MDILDTGITQRLTIFSPRRTGKTNFLLYDLSEEAKHRKRIVIYMSMWENPDAPHRRLIQVLADAVQMLKSKRFTLQRILATTVNKLKVESVTGLGKIGAELEFAAHPVAASTDELSQLSGWFKALHDLSKRRKILLMLDEIQHLSTTRQFSSFTHNLRSSLDIYKDTIEVVFTGSSRMGLQQLFSDSKAPLYAFSDQIEFPNLDRDFIEHLGMTYKKVTKRNLDTEKAWALFQKLDYNPYYMRMLIQAMVMQAENNIDACYKAVKENIALQLGYLDKLKILRLLDRQVYLAIAEGKAIYASDTIAALKAITGEKVTSGRIQKSVEKLIMLNVISQKGRGEYLIENPGFTQWCIDNSE